MSTQETVPGERANIELLLPWYATGRLDAAERARIEAALDRDPELRRQLEIIRDEVAETIAVNEALGSPSPGSLDRIMERVAADGRPMTAKAATFLDRIGTFFRAPSALAVRWAAAAALAVMIAQAAVIGTLLSPAGVYGTAGGGASDADGAFAIVRFRADAPIGRIGEAMTELGMTVTDGPKAGGLYIVRIGPASMSEQDRALAIERLRGRTEVVEMALDGKT